jgi:hypothetical protein
MGNTRNGPGHGSPRDLKTRILYPGPAPALVLGHVLKGR